jgi:nitroimidazol reductase NimA-like FMN-containing flavoprotein (pyridoxamine 5'-phosphate oxidase superfamily)
MGGNSPPVTYPVTDRTRIKRRPERGSYDRELVHSIIDEAMVCHVSFVLDGKPFILPTNIVRIGEDVFLHGSPTNRMLSSLADGAPAAIAVTHIDGIVAGRSGFGCSVDYRSIIIYASGVQVTGSEKEVVVDRVIQSIIPGHKVRPAKQKELDATLVLRFPLQEVSAKVRNCGVRDMPEDLNTPAWAGVIPLTLMAHPPITSPAVPSGVEVPSYASNYSRGAVYKLVP